MSLDSVRLSARSLRKQPVFTTVVVLSLALAIALNTTMYSVMNALAHPRLDMRDAGQLYWIRFYGDFRRTVSFADRDAALASAMHSYEAVTRVEGRGMAESFEQGQNLFEGALASVGENFFDVVGPRVIAGRTFLPADAPEGDRPIVLTEDAAAALFPGGESAVGRTVIAARTPHIVIGVVSRASNFPKDRVAGWTIAAPARRGMYSRLVRLRHGVSRDAAERDLRMVADRIALEAGEAPRDVAFRFTQAADPEFQIKGFHYALIFAVTAVLLVACANLANLQLARGLTRRRDLALRAALGATRRRLVLHLLTESTLLAIAGLVAGLLLAYGSARLLVAVVPPSVGEYVVAPQLSWSVIGFAVAASLVCLVATGLLPSLYISRADPNELLKSAAGTGATRRNRLRYGVLVCVEIGLALALSSGAAVMVRSALQSTGGPTGSLGYDSRPLVMGVVSPRRTDSVETYSATLQYAASHIQKIKGVAAATAWLYVPMQGSAVTVSDAGGAREFPITGFSAVAVTPDYFRTFQIPVIRGRDFLDGERDAGVAIIDEQTAHVLWPNANPVGALFKFGDAHSDLPYVRVVGVMGQQPGFGFDPDNAAELRRVRVLGQVMYLPGPSERRHKGAVNFPMVFAARALHDPAPLVVAIRRSLLQSGDLLASRVASMDDARGVTVRRETTRFTASLFALFAALGVGLAAFGVYGVVAHSVVERRREFGVRIALGATGRDILHAVLRESVVVALGGVALGLLGTKFGVPLLQGIAASGEIYNFVLFTIVAVALVTTVFVAAIIPALRATRVDPTESLRND